jgi:hypothetical protein
MLFRWNDDFNHQCSEGLSLTYYVFIISSFLHEENFKDTKGVISSRKAKDTDHIMTKIKETKGQAIIYKALSGTILGKANKITLIL